MAALRSSPHQAARAALLAWLLIAWASSALCGGAARAEQWTPPSSLEVPVLVVDSSGVDDIELPAALRELCSRVGIRVAAPFEAVPGQVVLLAHIRADGDMLELRVEDAQTRKLVGQRSVPRAETAALSRETLAHVLLGLVEPWMERARRAQAEPKAPVPQDLPSAPPEDAAALAVRLGLGAGPIVLAHEQWGARLVGHGSWTWSRSAAPTVALDAVGAPPVVVEAASVRARFWLVGARLRGRLSAFAGPRGAMDAALSAGVDLLGLKPVSAAAGTSLEPLSLRVQGVFGATLGGRVHLPRRIDLVFGVGADVDPTPREWLVDAEAGPTTLLRTTWVRPYALLGLDFVVHDTSKKAQLAP